MYYRVHKIYRVLEVVIKASVPLGAECCFLIMKNKNRLNSSYYVIASICVICYGSIHKASCF